MIKTAIYFVLLLGIAFFAYRRPVKTYDRKGYLTSIGHDAALSPEIAPAYAVKPLYVALLAWGNGSEPAFRLLSLAPYLAIGVILLAWTRSALWAGVLSATPAMVLAARMDVPDMLSTAFVLAGLFALYRQRRGWAAALLVISIWVRPDNAILCCLVLLYILFVEDDPSPQWYWWVLVLLAVSSYFTVMHFGYPYPTLLVNSFEGVVAKPGEAVLNVSFLQYLVYLGRGLRALCVQSEALIWLPIGVAGWKLSPKFRPLLALAALAVIIHLIAFPVPDDRYFLFAFLVSGASLACWLSAGTNATSVARTTAATG